MKRCLAAPQVFEFRLKTERGHLIPTTSTVFSPARPGPGGDSKPAAAAAAALERAIPLPPSDFTAVPLSHPAAERDARSLGLHAALNLSPSGPSALPLGLPRGGQIISLLMPNAVCGHGTGAAVVGNGTEATGASSGPKRTAATSNAAQSPSPTEGSESAAAPGGGMYVVVLEPSENFAAYMCSFD